MTDADPGSDVNFQTVDFDAVYRGASPFEGIDYGGIVPWDINGPQPAVVEFERAGRISGEVLDVGCGPGDNAIFLAGRGYHVTGVDIAGSAIEQARKRAGEHGVDVAFTVGDATELAEFENRFDSILDSALYHCLDSDQRVRYVSALRRVARPGAQLSLLCFSDALPKGVPGPTGLTEKEIRDDLGAAGWNVSDVRADTFLGRAPRALVEQVAAQFGLIIDSDDEGRLRLPAWAAAAHLA